MKFMNESLEEMDNIEKLSLHGTEIYENETGVVFVNRNDEIDLTDFIGIYMEYKEFKVLKPWDASDGFEVIKIVF